MAARRLVPGPRLRPGFLIIGAQKSGTTSLYDFLVRHPRVLPAVAKEIGYFHRRYTTRTFDWYLAHFPRVARAPSREPGLITGEATPTYLFHAAVPERVHRHLPEVRLIVVLRDPVERAHSHYRHAVDVGLEHRPFEDAVVQELAQLESLGEGGPNHPEVRAEEMFAYLTRGLYHVFLRRWYVRFPAERIAVLETRDLGPDPEPAVDTLTRLLDLEPSFPRRVEHLNVRSYAPIPEDLAHRLRELYRPHDLRLSELVGRDFSWAS